MKEMRLKASAEERDSILTAVETTLQETEDNKKAEEIGDKRALEIALRKKEETGLGNKWQATGYDRIPGKNENDKGTIEFIFEAQEEKPPKAWMDNCTKRAESFAGDPGAYCGSLWYHPEQFPGGEEKKGSFGEPVESVVSSKTVKLSSEDIKNWYEYTKELIAKNGTHETVKLLAKEAADKKVERPITFALSLVDRVNKDFQTSVQKSNTELNELGRKTDEAARSEKTFIGTNLYKRKIRAFAYYSKGHTKDASKVVDADRIIDLVNETDVEEDVRGLYRRAEDLYYEVVREEERDKEQNPETQNKVEKFENVENSFFSGLKDKVTLSSAIKIISSLLNSIESKAKNASIVRQLKYIAQSIEPTCIKATSGEKVDNNLLADYEGLENGIRTVLENEMLIDDATSVLTENAEAIEIEAKKVLNPEEKELKGAEKEDKKLSGDGVEKVFEPGVPSQPFEKVNALKTAIYDPAIEIPTEYEKIIGKGEVEKAEEPRTKKEEEIVQARETPKKTKEQPVTKAFSASLDIPSEEQVQVVLEKLTSKGLINDQTRPIEEGRVRKLTASQLSRLDTIVDKVNPEASFVTEGKVVDLSEVFKSDIPVK